MADILEKFLSRLDKLERQIDKLNTGVETADYSDTGALFGLGTGTITPAFQAHIRGTGQANTAYDNAGSKKAALYLQDAGAGVNNGGALVFGAYQGYFAAIKGLILNGAGNTTGDLSIQLRSNTANTTLTEVIRVTTAGRVGIGKSPAYQLELSTDSAAKPGTNTWTVASDVRIKEGIRPYGEGLNLIKQLAPVYFKYKAGLGLPADQEFVGFVAQDVEAVAPRMVERRPTKPTPDAPEQDQLYTNTGELMYTLINAVKELADRLDRLEARMPVTPPIPTK